MVPSNVEERAASRNAASASDLADLAAAAICSGASLSLACRIPPNAHTPSRVGSGTIPALPFFAVTVTYVQHARADPLGGVLQVVQLVDVQAVELAVHSVDQL